MPAGDRTGPAGMGPRTGRGAGYCAGYDRPGYANPAFRYGGYGRGFFGRRMSGGRGYRNMYYATGQPGWARYNPYPAGQPYPAPLTAEQEMEALKDQETWLQEQLDAVRGQMKSKEE